MKKQFVKIQSILLAIIVVLSLSVLPCLTASAEGAADVTACTDKITELTVMSDEVLLYSGNVLREARKLYDGLDASSQALVTNYSELVAAEQKYTDLAAEADADLIKMNTAHARFTNAATLMPDSFLSLANSCKKTLTVTNLANGGLNIFIPKGSAENSREAFTSTVNLYDAKFQFDNFVDNGAGANYKAGQMALLFGNGEFTDPQITDCFALVLNPYTGTLYAIPNEKGKGTFYNSDTDTNIDGCVVISSDYIKGANLENRRFSIELSENPQVAYDTNGNPYHLIDVTIEISGQRLTGTVPFTNVLEKAVSKIWASNNVSVAITLAKPYGNGNTRGYSVDWIGVDPGVVNGQTPNTVLSAADVTLNNAALDQGQVSFPGANTSVEFKATSDKVSVQLIPASNSSTVEVYVDGALSKTITTSNGMTKMMSKWVTAFEGLEPFVEHTVKLVNTSNSMVIMSGLNVHEVVCTHEYDNACDATCNVCGAVRTVADHVYDNACDATCNVCGAVRTAADHVYDNACDTTCNECGAVRVAADHVYDSECDVTCNVCGAERTTAADHVYDDDKDTTCNACGAVREINNNNTNNNNNSSGNNSTNNTNSNTNSNTNTNTNTNTAATDNTSPATGDAMTGVLTVVLSGGLIALVVFFKKRIFS